MRPISRSASLLGIAVAAALFAAACTSAAATPSYSVAGATMAAAATPTGAAPAGGITVGSTNDATLGAYLTGQNGMTLYVLTKDTADTSTCTGSCATSWPPFTVAAGTTITPPTGAGMAFATITHSDGTIQVTYNHMPLYYFAGDSAAGQTNGQGKSGVWFVAPLSGSVAPAATPTASAASNGY